MKNMMKTFMTAAVFLLLSQNSLMATEIDLKNEKPDQIVKQAAGAILQKLKDGREKYTEQPDLLREVV